MADNHRVKNSIGIKSLRHKKRALSMKSHEDALVFAYSLFHRVAANLSEKSWWGELMTSPKPL
jgi:hypothetical protein